MPVERKSLVDSRTLPDPTLPAWARQAGDAVLLNVHARPGARVAGVAGIHGDRLKIAIDAPPVDGKANDALLRFLASALARPRSHLEIHAGATHRDKCVKVAAADAPDVALRLAALIPAGK